MAYQGNQNLYYRVFALDCEISQILAPMQSNSQHNLNFIFSSPMSSFVHPQPTAFPPAQPDDPNSPVLFKHNINLVQTHISTVRSLAHEALNAMCVLHPLRGSLATSRALRSLS